MINKRRKGKELEETVESDDYNSMVKAKLRQKEKTLMSIIRKKKQLKPTSNQ